MLRVWRGGRRIRTTWSRCTARERESVCMCCLPSFHPLTQDTQHTSARPDHCLRRPGKGERG
eukprot:2197522-Rhodomonas_salina.2